jgi:hypothetical protein
VLRFIKEAPMRKKMTAMIVLLGFVFLLAPGLYSAPKKAQKFSFGILIKKPLSWMSSFYDFVSPYFGNRHSSSPSLAPDDSTVKVKPLGDSIFLRPSEKD